jgi:hypothetical protein
MIMAQKRARDQRARPENENGDPKAAIQCLVKG